MIARLHPGVSGARTTPAHFPTIDPALDSLLQAAAGPAHAENAAPEPPTLSVSQQARLIYVVAVLNNVGVLDYEGVETSDRTAKKFDDALSLATPGYQQLAPKDREASGTTLRQILSEHFHSRSDYKDALAMAPVRDEIKEIGAPCAGWVEQIGTETHVVIRSDISSETVSLEKVMAVADPLNWDKCCGFFCDMEELADRHEFSRVLEQVSIDCTQFRLKTPLKYWKDDEKVRDQYVNAFVNYDLDDNRKDTDDSQLVRVDNGTIYMTRKGEGVRVVSTKHVKIDFMSDTATAMWTCINGWAEIGEHMLFGCAKKRPRNCRPWKKSGTETLQARMSEHPPTFPPGARKELVKESMEMLTSCVEDAYETSSRFATSWLSGELQPRDYAQFTAEVAGRLASEPWRLLAEAAGRIGRSSGTRAPEPDANEGGGT